MIIGTTDLHLTDNPLDEYRHHFIAEHFPAEVKATMLDVDGIVILGDLTEEKDRHSARLVNRVVKALDRLSRLAPVICLMGNHDYHDEGHPFFEFLSYVENVKFIDKVTDGRDLPAPFRNVFGEYLFLPHTRDFERDWMEFLQADGKGFNGYDAVFAHNTFDGTETAYGRKLEGIPVDVFRAFKGPVLAGDIHNPQSVGNVQYIGAPYTVDFGDDYVPRILALDGHRVQWRAVGQYPQKTLVHIEQGKDLMDYKKRVGEGDILKVRVDVTSMDGWAAIVKVVHNQAASLKARAVRIEPVIEYKAGKKKLSKAGNESAISDKEIMRQFADRQRLDDPTLETGLAMLEAKGDK